MAKAEYRSSIRSKKLINAALADLLQEKPLDKITVTDVVNRAQINRGTFYAHYADISDVIDHLIQQTFSDIREVLSTQPQPLEHMSGTLLRRIQQLLEEDLDFYRKIMNSGISSVLMNRLLDVVLEYLTENEAHSLPGGRAQHTLAIRFCAGGLSSLYRDWFAGKLDITLDALTENAEDLLVSTISAITAQP